MRKRPCFHPVFFFDEEVWLKPPRVLEPGEGPIPWEHTPRHPLPAYETPTTPEQIPVPLQHNIRYAHETGVKKEHLAMIYGYPIAWIELFCVPPTKISQ